jgi:hypothetical protein
MDQQELSEMKLKQIQEALEIDTIHGPVDCGELDIDSVFTSDLLSDVLMCDQENLLLITSLTTEQVIRSAGIIGISAIVVTNNKTVSDGMIRLSGEQDIVIMQTRFPTFEACLKVGEVLKLS